MSDTYDVGYRKPPQHSRFAKGRSGNPAGRPKGSRSLKQRLLKLSNETMTMRWNGEPRTVRGVDALFYTAMALSLKGNATVLMKLLEFLSGLDETTGDTPKLRPPSAVLIVPGLAESAEDWEREASRQQAPYRGLPGDPLEG